MAGEEAQEGAARVHWLIVGRFGGKAPSGRAKITNDGFQKMLEERSIAHVVEVEDRLGAGARRTVTVACNKLRSFTLSEVIARDPTLLGLQELAQALGGSPARPSADETVKRVEALVGSGRLLAQVRAAAGPALLGQSPEPVAATAAAPSSVGSALLDEVLSQAPGASEGASTLRTAAGAVDAFVGAIRGTGSPAESAAQRAAQKAIEDAVYATAAEVLKHPELSRLEAAWRGLRWVLEECPSGSSMGVELLDASPLEAVDRIEATLDDDLLYRPDAIAVVEPVADVAILRALADLAEGLQAPVLVTLDPRLFAAPDASALAAKLEGAALGTTEGLQKEWVELRLEDAARWLFAAVNPAVVLSEGAGIGRRAVLASPVFALLAMLARSFHHSGGFGRILGVGSEIKAPGVHSLTAGSNAGLSVPTEAFLSIRSQGVLAGAGFLGLGSGRNSDMIKLASAKSASGSEDAVPLPAQIMTGRVVRFARWIRDQLPAGLEDREVASMFEQAGEAFLFPGMAEAAQISAKIVRPEGGAAVLAVTASVRADLAGIPLQLAFGLPLSS